METRNLPAGTLSNSSETIVWQYTVPRSGQFDLRLVIDFADVIDEYDEGNNNNYLVVTGASLDDPGLVSSFAPSILVVLLVGIAISLFQRKTRD
jgi:subtilase family serine protease